MATSLDAWMPGAPGAAGGRKHPLPEPPELGPHLLLDFGLQTGEITLSSQASSDGSPRKGWSCITEREPVLCSVAACGPVMWQRGEQAPRKVPRLWLVAVRCGVSALCWGLEDTGQHRGGKPCARAQVGPA